MSHFIPQKPKRGLLWLRSGELRPSYQRLVKFISEPKSAREVQIRFGWQPDSARVRLRALGQAGMAVEHDGKWVAT